MFNPDGAFNLTRDAPEAPQHPAPVTGFSSPEAAPVKGSGDDVSAKPAAQLLAVIFLALGVVLAVLIPESQPAFKATDGFILLTGFYVAAQAIERFLELLPPGCGTRQAKANRAVLFSAIGFVLGVLAAEYLGLFFLHAIGAAPVSGDLDVIVTAIAIGGGTKPLHDLIKNIEKTKQTPQATH